MILTATNSNNKIKNKIQKCPNFKTQKPSQPKFLEFSKARFFCALSKRPEVQGTSKNALLTLISAEKIFGALISNKITQNSKKKKLCIFFPNKVTRKV